TAARERRQAPAEGVAAPTEGAPEPEVEDQDRGIEPSAVIPPLAAKPTWTPPAPNPVVPATQEPSAPPKDEAPRKPKRRGRASIPSWDEIMFGGAAEKSSDDSDG
ncbi:MAG: hypothetical protein QM572_07100, partial [Nocardioides sp.]